MLLANLEARTLSVLAHTHQSEKNSRKSAVLPVLFWIFSCEKGWGFCEFGSEIDLNLAGRTCRSKICSRQERGSKLGANFEIFSIALARQPVWWNTLARHHPFLLSPSITDCLVRPLNFLSIHSLR